MTKNFLKMGAGFFLCVFRKIWMPAAVLSAVYISVFLFVKKPAISLAVFSLAVILYLIYSRINGKKEGNLQPVSYKKQSNYIMILKFGIFVGLSLLGAYYIKEANTSYGLWAITFAVIQTMFIFRPLKKPVQDISPLFEKEKVNAGNAAMVQNAEFIKPPGGSNSFEMMRNGFVFLSVVVLFYLSLFYFQSHKMAPAFVFFAAGSMMIGVWGQKFKAEKEIKPSIPVYYDYILLIILVAAAWFIRSYKIADIPPGISFDEAIARPVADGIMKGHKTPVYLSSVVYIVGTMYYFWLAVWAKLTSLTIENARLMSAAAGTISVALAYFAAKQMFDRRTGIVSAIVMTFFYYQIIYSRVAWLWIFVPFLALFTIWFYFKGEREGRPEWFVLAGAFMGINLYFYNAAKMLPFIFAAYWVFLLMSPKYRKWLISNTGFLIVFVLASLAVFGPMFQYIWEFPQQYFARINSESAIKSSTSVLSLSFFVFLANQSVKVFQMFLTLSCGYAYNNYPFIPLLDRASAFFFLAGLGYSVFNWRKKEYAFLVILFVFSLAAAIFSVSHGDPNSQRAILSIVPVVIFISLGVVRLWDMGVAVHKRIAKPVLSFVLGIFLIFSSAWYYQIYFEKYPVNDGVKSDFFSFPANMSRYARAKMDENKRVFASNFFLEQTSFVLYKSATFLDNSLLPFHEYYDVKSNGIVVMNEAIYDEQMGIFREYFNDIKIEREYDFYADFDRKKSFYRNPDIFKPRLLYVAADIPRESVIEAYSLTANYISGGEKKSILVKNSEMPAIPEADIIEIKGLISIPVQGRYEFDIMGTQGNFYINDSRVTNETNLYKGLHKFRVIVKQKNEPFVIKWKTPNHNDFRNIEDRFFLNSYELFGLLATYTTKGGDVFRQLEASPTHRYYYRKPRIQFKHGDSEYNVSWKGYLTVDKEAEYSFKLETEFDASVYIAGRQVYRYDMQRKGAEQSSINLKPGKHTVEVRYFFNCNPIIFGPMSSLRFLYAFDGENYVVVPYSRLKPF